MLMNEKQNGENHVRTNAIRVAFLLLTCVFVLTLLGFLWLVRETHDLGRQNRALILENQRQDRDDISNSILLCRRNIEGVRQIFLPFYPVPPRTEEQQAAVDKFNNRVDSLKKNCSKQLSK